VTHHYFATQLFEQGIDLRYIHKQPGNNCCKTTLFILISQKKAIDGILEKEKIKRKKECTDTLNSLFFQYF
jgi:site-specific recombinase XerD